jgi:N-acetylmuramoyl-L-alanine amidase
MSRTKVVDRGVKYARYYVIRNTNIPSILVEGGFVSNSNERSRMKTAWFRDAIARGIADGVQSFRRGG